MPASAVDWTPALVVLGVGVVLGIAFMWQALRAGRPRSATADLLDLERRDLQAKRDALIDQLRELEDTSSKRSSQQLAAERYALELEAARAWQALDEHVAATPSSAPPARHAGEAATATETPAAAAPASAWKGFLWGVGSVSVVLALVMFVSRSAEQRSANGSPTGGAPMDGAVPAAQDAELARLQAAVAARPEDDDARLDLARLALMRQDMMSVFEQTQAVLQRQPDNARALAYQALVRMAMGQPELAESMLKQAIAVEPNLIDGYVHLMLVYVNLGRNREAEAMLATASQRFPDQAESLGRLYAQMRAAATGQAAVAAGSQGEGSTGPAAAPAAGAPAGSAGGRSVSGVLTLDAGAASLAPGSVVYVMLRPAGVHAGPPLAAIRLAAASFPLAFSIGDADSMTGDPIPDKVLVEARVDRDGDVSTRDPGDPAGSADGVAMGSANVQIPLRPGK